jgi:AbrB family looped-hinge helix DNA binding protein
MITTLTVKGQVTIPKRIRDTLHLVPGSRMDFELDEQGRVVICKAGIRKEHSAPGPDRFERARGRATVKWKTDDLMKLLRGED